MNIKHFPYFLRTFYPSVPHTDEEIENVGIEFKKYLLSLNLSQEVFDKLTNIDIIHIAINRENPFTEKGYHPAFVLHFHNFCKSKLPSLN